MKLGVNLRLTSKQLNHYLQLLLLRRENGVGAILLELAHPGAQALDLGAVRPALVHQVSVDGDDTQRHDNGRGEEARMPSPEVTKPTCARHRRTIDTRSRMGTPTGALRPVRTRAVITTFVSGAIDATTSTSDGGIA